MRIGETNQLANEIEKILPNKADREALYFYRELKNNPQKLESALNDPTFAPYKEQISKALNPTPEMQKAYDLVDNYLTQRGTEGANLGYVKNNLPDYLTHIVQKGENAGDMSGFKPTVSRSPISRGTPFGQGRYYNDILDVIKAGKKPATLDTSNVLRIYGSRDAVANSTAKFINDAKSSGAGKWFSPDEVPEGWARLDPYNNRFTNTVPFVTKEGEAAKMTQVFAVPNQVADAMKPITEPDWLKRVGGIGKWRMAQSWAKYMELSLSLFHSKAETLTALNSMGPINEAKALASDMSSSVFKDVEKDLLQHGGTSPILGGEYNAYKSLKPESKNIITNNPITRAFNSLADKTSGLTFDQLVRRYKVMDYSGKVAKWMSDNPEATDAELKAAKEKFANYVNGVYGGLNWEKMGVSKSILTVLRTLFLAPDWTFSNLGLPIQAIKGSVPFGKTAKFVAASFGSGILMTQLTNLALHGKLSSDPFNVTLGYRKDGTEAKANIFFAGGAKDLANLFTYIGQEGAGGIIHFASNKAAPGVQTAAQLLTNKDFYGQDIRTKGAGPVQNTLNTVKNLGLGMPVPFVVSGPAQLYANSQGTALPSEYFLSMSGMGTLSQDKPASDVWNNANAVALSGGATPTAAQLQADQAEASVKNLITMNQGQMSGEQLNGLLKQQSQKANDQVQMMNQLKQNLPQTQQNVGLMQQIADFITGKPNPKAQPQQVSPGIFQKATGGYEYAAIDDSGNQVLKSASDFRTAQKDMIKNKFQYGSQTGYQLTDQQGNPVNDLSKATWVLTRNSETGTVSIDTKEQYSLKLNKATLTNAKDLGDIQTWMSTAQQQLQLYQQEFNDPNVDPATKTTDKNDYLALAKLYAKYAATGLPGMNGSGAKRAKKVSFKKGTETKFKQFKFKNPKVTTPTAKLKLAALPKINTNLLKAPVKYRPQQVPIKKLKIK